MKNNEYVLWYNDSIINCDSNLSNFISYLEDNFIDYRIIYGKDGRKQLIFANPRFWVEYNGKRGKI